ncbi:MAG: flagellar hook-length control protein FliK [Thermodesulfobacteriota bacterium]|nr:flagellar hook-length control protein FliK [Thermodesulfobacteriota bacterium]
MILKTASLLNDCKTVHNKNHEKFKGKGDFLSNILASLSRVQKSPFNGQNQHYLKGMSADKKGPRFYLESFRKGLLAQGKPLNNISLNKEDLFLLKKFLLQCGFPEQKTERFLNELKNNNTDAEINLANFFQKIAELDPTERSEKNDKETCMIEPSAIPHLESALRNFGLTPKELDNVFSAAKVEGGGLDPKRFAIKLKQITIRLSDKIQTIKDHDTVKQISNKMEIMGLNLPDKAKAGKISIEDFITSLEQMSKRQGKENSPPPELKSTMGRLLERVVISGEKQKFVFSPQAVANFKLHDPIAKEKMNDNVGSLDNEDLLTNLNDKNEKINNIGRQNIEYSHHEKKVELFSNSAGGKGFQNMAGKEGHDIKSGSRIMEPPKQTTVSNFAETINAVESNDKSFRSSLPAYLVDQVGKQISRSILRGDRIVRLQLKPPDLGRVKINIDIKDNVLKLGMIAEHSAVKELLLSNVHELRGALVSQGIKLENIDIQINYGFGQSLASSKEWMNEGKRWNQDSGGGGAFMSKNSAEVLQSEPLKMVVGNNLLNLVA